MCVNKHLHSEKHSGLIIARKILKTLTVKCSFVLTVIETLVHVEVWLSTKCTNMLKPLVNQFYSVTFVQQPLLMNWLLKHICNSISNTKLLTKTAHLNWWSNYKLYYTVPLFCCKKKARFWRGFNQQLIVIDKLMIDWKGCCWLCFKTWRWKLQYPCWRFILL